MRQGMSSAAREGLSQSLLYNTCALHRDKACLMP
jgi:hypothetical protein